MPLARLYAQIDGVLSISRRASDGEPIKKHLAQSI